MVIMTTFICFMKLCSCDNFHNNYYNTFFIFDDSIDKDPVELGNKVTELKQQFQSAKDDIEKLPGIESSREEQLKQMDAHRRQLVAKIELLRKYKSLSVFDTTTIDQ